MRLGVLILPEHRWVDAAQLWRRAEQLGYHHAWTYDHLAWRTLRDSPWFAAVPTLAAAASVTSTIRLGTLVATPTFRHPVPFAREVVALDDLSEGRLTLGLGAGGPGWDATVLGQEALTPAQRGDRFVEFVDFLDRLLRQPETTHRGRYWQAQGAMSEPGCIQEPRVPFAVAATGPRAMLAAADHATVWVTNGDRRYTGPPLGPAEGAAVVARQWAAMARMCEARGRDPATLDRLVLTGPRLDAGLTSSGRFADVVDAYAEVGVTDLVVHWPRLAEPYAGDPSILESIAPPR